MLTLSYRNILSFFGILTSGFFLTGCANPKTGTQTRGLTTVAHVNLPRYMGDWHVIATIPNSIERNAVGSVESYKLRDDGKIANTFTYHKESFNNPQKKLTATAWVVNHQTNAEWKVQFIWPFAASYLVLDMDPNYQWTVVGHPSKKYGWIMARETSLPDTTYRKIISRLAAQGYDTSQFVKVKQKP